MTPFDDFAYLVNNLILGEQPTIEDFILLVGTLVAFIAFILWCCFPIQPKDTANHRQFSCRTLQGTFDSNQVHSSKNGTQVLQMQSDYSVNYNLKNANGYHCCT